jgi:hypothetical protein
MSDVEEYSDSGEGDSEGSLVDFIVDSNDEEEVEDEVDTEMEVENGDDNVDEDPDDVREITQQYSDRLENEGIVTDPSGVRRSMRVSKGRPPTRYVDEDDIEKLSSEDSYDADDDSEEFEVEDVEEDD